MDSRTTDEKRLLTRAQLASFLQVGEGRIRKLTDEGRIPFIPVAGAAVRGHRFDPEAVVEALLRGVCSEPGATR